MEESEEYHKPLSFANPFRKRPKKAKKAGAAKPKPAAKKEPLAPVHHKKPFGTIKIPWDRDSDSEEYKNG